MKRGGVFFVSLAGWLAAVGLPRGARGDDKLAPAATDPAQDDDGDDDGAQAINDTQNDLEQKMHDLEQRLADTQDLVLKRRPLVTTSGYADFGFFATQGNGSGVLQDLGSAKQRYFPQYADPATYGWVFLGDLLAPAINSRGEPADLGDLPGTTGANRFDSVHARGAPSFIVNEVNLTLNAAVGDNALATVSLDFMPRSGADFHLGDVFEVDLAQLEWMLGPARRTSLFAGKMESVLGIEYRDRKAVQRFGITPSLIARYTTGTPLGLKVRSKLGAGDWLVLAAAVTNGSSTTESFHFYDEIDSNAGKTASARVGVAPLPQLELGVSGEYGAQDRALDSANALWFFGADVQGHFGRLELKGQWLIGHGVGETSRLYDLPHRPYGLNLHGGAYLEGDLMLTPLVGVMGRAEIRDAEVWLGNVDGAGLERLYITHGWRAVAGVRVVASEHVVVKAELLHNGEYGGVPLIRDDVFTSSLVLSFDLPLDLGIWKERPPMKRISLYPSLAASLWLSSLHAVPARAETSPTNEQLAADVARLSAQVRDQRALIMQLVRIEQEHYDLLLRLYSGRGADGSGPAGGPPLLPTNEPATDDAAEASTPGAAPKAGARTATLRGKITSPGGALKDVYVYVANVKAPAVRGKTVEIAQRDKQFVPEVLVVQRGTRVSFPNYDSVFHNVFSPSTPHPFDLGSYRAGDAAKSVDLTSPGVLDVFCNVHARMHANVLVVPNALYARVGADGAFELKGVPIGARSVVVWSPTSKPLTQTVDVGAQGAEVSLSLTPQAAAAHNNKLGQPYGSYKD